MLIPSDDRKRLQEGLRIAMHWASVIPPSAGGARSVDRLLLTMKQQDFQVRVYQNELSEATNAGKGYTLPRKDGSFDIGLLKGLNYCWHRFVLCKELLHVLTHSNKERNMNIEDHLASACGIVVTETSPSASTLSELFAEVWAMEFLIPHSERIAGIEAGTDHAVIAQNYKCPLVMVEKYFHPGNIESLRPE
jgi:hypothetical protein